MIGGRSGTFSTARASAPLGFLTRLASGASQALARGFALCLVSLAGLALVGCDEATPDTAPAFTRPAPDQAYTVGEAISPLLLPEAVGGNGALSYELRPAVPGLTFDPAARTLRGTPGTAGTYAMTYRVSDADDNTAASDADTLSFTITVREADTAPRFAERVTHQTYTVGEAITPLVLPEALGGNGPLSYELRPAVPGLTFDPAARTLRGTPGTAGTYAMTYRVSDADDNTSASDAGTLSFTITVREGDTAPRFAERVAHQTYTVGAAITPLLLPQALGGNGPLRYELRPTVPGLTFDPAARTLRGTPGTAGTYAMTYRVTDADDNTAPSDADTLSFTITVGERDTAPRFAVRVADQTYTVGEAIGPLLLPQALGGNAPLRYELRPTVPGLTFDPAARTLRGTPGTAGTYAMTYRVTDADDNTAASDADTLSFTITVREADTAPRFAERVAHQTYTVGEAITPLLLPQALGGNGPLSYELHPEVPGLTFDPAARTLRGTPGTAGTYAMTYRVSDADSNTADSDADTLMFSVAVRPPPARSCAYRGSGDDVCPVNPGGHALDEVTLSLRLGTAQRDVYVIATNTNSYPASARVERLDAGPEAQRQRPVARREHPSHGLQPDSSGHAPPWVVEFNNNPPPMQRSGAPQRSLRAQAQRAVAEGDRFTFTAQHFGDALVPATARRVVSDGSTTLVVWVADRDWSATCRATDCMTREMVDAAADRFLRPGPGNDIHDWLTGIFGSAWGPHDYTNLIPPESARQIHILFLDIDADGIPSPGQSRVVGYFHSVHNYLRTSRPTSNERLIFFMDAALMADRDGPTWEASDRRPSAIISVLAHEFQHMIHFYQKPVLRDAFSETWLNEMASEVAEDLVADKIESNGPRAVAHDDPAAGEAGIERGRLPRYNFHNDIQVTAWDYSDSLKHYSISYALGAYLARTYGGAALFGDIVASGQSGVAAVEAALRTHGHTESFGDVLANWAVANLLSDNPRAPAPYRYNAGATWSTSRAGGQIYRLGSINLYHYRYYLDPGGDEYLDGPGLYGFEELSGGITRHPHSNAYTALGRMTGTVRLQVNADAGMRITVVMKEESARRR